MTTTIHVHQFTRAVRSKGRRVRKSCDCGRIGPWEPSTEIPNESPDELRAMTVTQLCAVAKSKGLRGYSRLTKDALIERITAT